MAVEPGIFVLGMERSSPESEKVLYEEPISPTRHVSLEKYAYATSPPVEPEVVEVLDMVNSMLEPGPRDVDDRSEEIADDCLAALKTENAKELLDDIPEKADGTPEREGTAEAMIGADQRRKEIETMPDGPQKEKSLRLLAADIARLEHVALKHVTDRARAVLKQVDGALEATWRTDAASETSNEASRIGNTTVNEVAVSSGNRDSSAKTVADRSRSALDEAAGAMDDTTLAQMASKVTAHESTAAAAEDLSMEVVSAAATDTAEASQVKEENLLVDLTNVSDQATEAMGEHQDTAKVLESSGSLGECIPQHTQKKVEQVLKGIRSKAGFFSEEDKSRLELAFMLLLHTIKEDWKETLHSSLKQWRTNRGEHSLNHLHVYD